MMRYATLLLTVALICGCGSVPQPAKPTSVADSVALSYATIEGAANQVAAACWPVTVEPVPGSPCDAQGLISSEKRDDLKVQLQDAKDYVDMARTALTQASAESRLAQADAVLALVIAALEAR